MFDHLSLGVSNLDPSVTFYDHVLAPLGIQRLVLIPGVVAAYGVHRPQFWIARADQIPLLSGFHLAFSASDRAAVDTFYATARAQGAQDDGPPGLRPHYHANYYAAFVIDPNGYRLEAVCHQP